MWWVFTSVSTLVGVGTFTSSSLNSGRKCVNRYSATRARLRWNCQARPAPALTPISASVSDPLLVGPPRPGPVTRFVPRAMKMPGPAVMYGWSWPLGNASVFSKRPAQHRIEGDTHDREIEACSRIGEAAGGRTDGGRLRIHVRLEMKGVERQPQVGYRFEPVAHAAAERG